MKGFVTTTGFRRSLLSNPAEMKKVYAAAEVGGVLGVDGNNLTDYDVKQIAREWPGEITVSLSPLSYYPNSLDTNREQLALLGRANRIDNAFPDRVIGVHLDCERLRPKTEDEQATAKGLYDYAYYQMKMIFRDVPVTWFASLDDTPHHLDIAEGDGDSFRMYWPYNTYSTIVTPLRKVAMKRPGRSLTAYVAWYEARPGEPWGMIDPQLAHMAGCLCSVTDGYPAGGLQEINNVVVYPGPGDIENWFECWDAFMQGMKKERWKP